METLTNGASAAELRRGEPGSFEKADAWLGPWPFAAVLAGLILACFPNVIFGLATFHYRDFALFGYPLAAYHKESFWHGELPFWNPYNDCGLPFLAQWNTLTLYPLSLIYLLLPLPWSLNLFCLGHLFLGGMGAYFLGHRWTGNRLAAAVAGIGFAYNGLTWDSLMWPNNIAALGWMPWVLLAQERAWERGGRHIVLAALAGALQMLTGAPEMIALTWLMVGALWVMEFVTSRSRFKVAGRGLSAGLLVAALASIQLLPFLDLLAHSHRDTSFGDSQWAMPATGWANYLVPLFHCVQATRGVPVQHDQYWTSSYYAGVGIFALALLAVWQNRQRRVWLLAGLTLLSMLMALGNEGFVYAGLRKLVPQLGFMRFPIKFITVASFILPFLGAHGVAWWRELPADRRRNGARRLGALVAGLIVAIGIILFLAWKFPQSNDRVGATLWNGLRSALFLGGVAGCLILLQRGMTARRLAVFQITLLVLLWMDVFTHVPTLSPTVSPNVLEAGSMRQYLTSPEYKHWPVVDLKLGDARLRQTLDSRRRMYLNTEEDAVSDIWQRRRQLYDDVNLLDDIPKVDGFYSLFLREMNTVLYALDTSTNDGQGLKSFLGVSHESEPTNWLDWAGVEPHAPMVTAGQQPVFVREDGTLEALLATNFDGRKIVMLPPETAKSVHAAAGAAQLNHVTVSANRISAAVSAPSPAMVVVAQAYYHWWRVYVDGRAVPLWRANYAFQAFEVPAGAHQVRLEYEDSSFQTGAVITLGALLVCAMIWRLNRRQTRQDAAA